MTEGCVHLHIKRGKIKNVFCHLSGLPEEGVIHLKVDSTFSNKQFIQTHEPDRGELYVMDQNTIFDLGSNSILEK